MVEPAHPGTHPRRAPVHTVVERADAEHRGERHGVDPGREELAAGVREGDEHGAGRDRGIEGVLVEDTAQTGLLENFHPESVPYTRVTHTGPLAQLVEQGTFNPKVAGSIPARPTGSETTRTGPRSHERLGSDMREDANTASTREIPRSPRHRALRRRGWVRPTPTAASSAAVGVNKASTAASTEAPASVSFRSSYHLAPSAPGASRHDHEQRLSLLRLAGRARSAEPLAQPSRFPNAVSGAVRDGDGQLGLPHLCGVAIQLAACSWCGLTYSGRGIALVSQSECPAGTCLEVAGSASRA